MDINRVRNLLHERLATTEQVKKVAEKTGISAATIYRYKAAPESIPLGKLIALSEVLGFPLGDSATWFKTEFVDSERRRLELEKSIANGSKRLVVTPTFTINAQIPEYTEYVMRFDYGARSLDRLPEYLELRQERRVLYEKGSYISYEIISGSSYCDFYFRRSKFRGITKELRDKQVKNLLRTLDLNHIHRRVYLKRTPELPIVSIYSGNIAIVRADDFVIEFQGEGIPGELTNIFHKFFDTADLKSYEEVAKFLKNPDVVLESYPEPLSGQKKLSIY